MPLKAVKYSTTSQSEVMTVPVGLLPHEFVARLQGFLERKLTGNVTLNVKNGRVLGMEIKEVVKASK